MKYNITNIKWDTDGKSPKKLKLPSSAAIDVPSDMNPENFIADHLSNTYGFCVESYNFEPELAKEQKVLKNQLEKMGYKVHITVDQGAIGAEVENWTKGGEDMLVWLKPFSLDELKSYAEDYDIDEHIELMMQDNGYKEHFTYREAIEDQEDWLKELKQDIHNLEILRGIFHEKEHETAQVKGSAQLIGAAEHDYRMLKEKGKKGEKVLHFDGFLDGYAEGIKDTVARNTAEIVKALVQYRQLNINWWREPEKTAERLQDFIGKEPLAVTASDTEAKTRSEDTITVILTATQQRHLLDYLFEDKKNSCKQIAAMSPDNRAVMSAYIESIDKLVKTLSQKEDTPCTRTLQKSAN